MRLRGRSWGGIAAALSLGDFVMAHRHMQGIRRRAEAQWRAIARPAVTLEGLQGLREFETRLRPPHHGG